MGTEIRLSSGRLRYGFSLKELAQKYGITYYQVQKMHEKNMLEDYIKWHNEKGGGSEKEQK